MLHYHEDYYELSLEKNYTSTNILWKHMKVKNEHFNFYYRIYIKKIKLINNNC